MFNVYID